MFNWNKKGQIWAPSLQNTWMQEYGQNPNAVVLGDRIRIYFSSRKKSEREGGYISYIFFVDVAKDNPSKILYVHDQPILNTTGKGKLGSFDEFGTMPGSILQRGKETWLYYVGWSRSNKLPYKWANGIAISKDEGITFERFAEEPIVSSQYDYPYLQACPRVYQFGENQFYMWYASGIEWFDHEGRLNPIYVIMSAQSRDGIHWDLSQQPTLPMVANKECQSSATVFKRNNLYHMFFSYRDVLPAIEQQKQYRIGYAWSKDLVEWQREDRKAGIDVSTTGWDSEAVCYPHIVEVEDKTYLFYSGNQYGCAGFGYAELAT